MLPGARALRIGHIGHRHIHKGFLPRTLDLEPGFQTLALALSRTCPFSSSTEYSTEWQPYSLRICSVFFCRKDLKESKPAELCSPALFLASIMAWKRA